MKHRVSWGGILLLAGIFAAAAVICAADMLVEKYTPCEMVIAAISAMTAVNDSTSIEP